MLLLAAVAADVEEEVVVTAGASKPGGGGVKLVRFGGGVGLVAGVVVGACGVSPSLMERLLISTLVIFESANLLVSA